jgi:hypothetical protein
MTRANGMNATSLMLTDIGTPASALLYATDGKSARFGGRRRRSSAISSEPA